MVGGEWRAGNKETDEDQAGKIGVGGKAWVLQSQMLEYFVSQCCKQVSAVLISSMFLSKIYVNIPKSGISQESLDLFFFFFN